MIVFDFDKTLTYQDTLSGFYQEVAQKGENNKLPYQLKKLLLISFAVLYKLKLISNTQLKKAGVWLFLKGLTEKELRLHAGNYAKKIKLNNVYASHFNNTTPENRLIITASFVNYVQPVFPDDQVFGSQLKMVDGRVVGLAVNMYKAEKVNQLKKLGIQQIEAVYTDSFSDKPLMDIADDCFIVNGEQIKKLK